MQNPETTEAPLPAHTSETALGRDIMTVSAALHGAPSGGIAEAAYFAFKRIRRVIGELEEARKNEG